MAQLALGVVGGVAGFYLGSFVGAPTLGAQIGFGLGSMAGAALAAPDTQGPRLQDLAVAISSYGQPISQTYGGVRVPCPVIWAAPLQESESSESAKGGPEVTTFSYSGSFAVAVGEGEIAGIRRIWLDTKVVYDVREGADASTQQQAIAFAEFFTFYTGSETQDPDPTIESFNGAGEVEAYRGTAYIVFDGLPLASHGNRIPAVRVETTTEPEDAVPLEEIVPYRVNRWALDADGVPYHVGGPTVYDSIVFDGTPIAGSYATFAAALAAAQVVAGIEYEYPLCITTSENSVASVFADGARLAEDPQHANIMVGRNPIAFVLEIPSGVPGNPYSKSFALSGVLPESPAYGDIGTSALIREEASGTNTYRLVHSTFVEIPPDGYPTTVQHATEYPSTFPAPDKFPSVVAGPNIIIRCTRTPFIPAQACEVGDPVALGIAQLPGNAGMCMSSTGELSLNYQYVDTPGTYRQLAEVVYTGGVLASNGLGPVLRNTDPNYAVQAYWEAAAADAGVSGAYGVDYPVETTDAGIGEADATQVEAGSILLSDIVEHISIAAGLDVSQVDVSALTDVVRGYTRTRVMSARSAIEPLRIAYTFDAVESGAEIKFVKRGGASIATLDADDIGAGIEQPAAQLMEHQRGQQTELPNQVTIMYQSADADFEVGTQQSRRRVGDSQQAVQLELTIVMTDLLAAQIADMALYDTWVSRNRRTVHTLLDWSHVEPTDIITVDDGTFEYRLRTVEKTDAGGVISLICVDDDASTWSPNSVAGPVNGGGANDAGTASAPMQLHILDVPIVRQADDATPLGYYLGGSGFAASGWPGGGAYRSADDGATYTLVQEVSKVATMGYTETIIASWGGGNIVDESSSVEITLHAGSLSTITRAQLLQGGNPCVIGSEVLQFQRATLLANGRYLLTGFLRARVGTEDQLAAHDIAERFVLLDPGTIYRPAGALGEVGVATVWKGVTAGTAVADAFERDFTHSGRGAKPLAPIQLAAGETGTAGTYSVTWVRRTRIPHQWADESDAPLGETSEAYLVEVLDGETVQSSQTVATQSATVTASAGDTVRVRQVSDLIGPGMPATTTIE